MKYWEYSRFGNLTFDLGVFVGGFCFIDNKVKLNEDSLEKVVESYNKIRELSRFEKLNIIKFALLGAGFHFRERINHFFLKNMIKNN